MAKLMVHRNILQKFSKLPLKVQKRIPELIDEFQKDPFSESIGMHPVSESMLDSKVRGIKKLPDGYRAIVIAPERGDTYLLIYIDKHDEAYQWARNKRFEVHEMTGVFQIFDAEELQSATTVTPSPQTGDYPLSRLSDDELFQAGVPKPLIPAVKSIQSDEALEALGQYLPPDCRDVLFGLAAGMALDDALAEMLGAAPRDTTTPAQGPGDFTNIEAAPNFDLVLVEGHEHLKAILQGSIEEWRIFLHPYQRKLVEMNTTGPICITGSAGTGKTVALMHRAVNLARQLKDSQARVLVTTYTTNLSVTIKQHLQRLSPEAAPRIEVTNLHALARTICARAGWRGRVAEDEDMDQIWEEIWVKEKGDLPLSKEEMRKEYNQIVDPNGIEDEETYLTTVRTGRPRLSRDQRKKVWSVFRLLQSGLKKRNLLTFEGAVHQARLAIEQGKSTRYAHVLVDEIQDFGLEALRLIRAMSPITDNSPNPLCMVGDGHQRIYRSKVPLSRAGIDVRGRSRRLKINYRTTEQIRSFAHGILHGLEIDDLDGGVIATTGDHSVFRGAPPKVEHCASERIEADVITDWVKRLTTQYHLAPHEICITPYKAAVRTALNDAKFTTFELQSRQEDPGASDPGIRLGDMNRIKGLEFRAVALACASSDSPINHLDKADLSERCKCYVAATRAREHLLVTVAAKE